MNILTKAAVVFMALLVTAAPARSAVTEFVVPSGPVITLQDGRTIEGHVVEMNQAAIIVLAANGARESLPRSTIRTVTFKTVTGQEIAGELVGWRAGVYQLATPEAAVKVYSIMPTAIEPPEPAVAAGGAERKTAAATAGDEADVGQGGPQTVVAAATDQTPASVNGTDRAAAGTQEAALTPTSDLSIQVSVENSKENGPPVAFNIQLSRPSDSSVVLIYATIDGTAVNGQDYEANRGVIVLKPGEQVARIEAPVIDDTEKEGQEHLQLFLTVDPTVATVESRQIIATIDDDDQN
ncbi:MAG: Calx-beta domain-containing protein [Alphaproteobacteria bacterium]